MTKSGELLRFSKNINGMSHFHPDTMTNMKKQKHKVVAHNNAIEN